MLLGKNALPSYTQDMRLFYGVLFDAATKDNLYKVQDRLEPSLANGTRTRRENLHLTMCFLGERDPSLVEPLASLLSQIPLSPLDLTFTHLGRFAKRDGDVIWAGVSHSEVLHELQHHLVSLLMREHIPVEDTSFQAHVTLFRRARCPQLVPVHPFGTKQCALALMHSHQEKGLLTYTPLETKFLQ